MAAGKRSPPADAASPSTGGVREQLLIGSLAVLAAATLVRVLLASEVANKASAAAFVVFVITALPNLGRREWLLVSASVILAAVTVAVVPDAESALSGAFELATYLAAFLLLLGTLREAAARSESTRACGAWLTGHRPSRRYLALHVGGHLLALLLSFGILALLGPMIQRGVAATAENDHHPGLAEARLRRQISALLRGFSWIVAWSPTTITQALLLSVVPGTDADRLIACGLGLTIAMLGLGWAEDQIRWRALDEGPRTTAAGFAGAPANRLPRTATARVVGVAALLIGAVIVTKQILGTEIVPTLMVVVPCVSLAWMTVQRHGRHARPLPIAATLSAGRALLRSLPVTAPEVVTFASAGFIGKLAAALVPPDAIAAALGAFTPPPVLILVLVPLVILMAAQVALSPVMFVVFLGTVLSQTPALNIDPTVLALALGSGWALGLAGAPFTASVLILARVTAIPPATLSWRWNGAFTILAYGIVVFVLLALALG